MNIQGVDIEMVDDYRFLGVHLNNKLDWIANVQFKKEAQRETGID